jgi:uncharacterized protein YpbB
MEFSSNTISLSSDKKTAFVPIEKDNKIIEHVRITAKELYQYLKDKEKKEKFFDELKR